MFTLAFMVKSRFLFLYIFVLIECLSKNIIKFEFENLLYIYACLINSNIFVVSTAELFWENIYLFGKYLFIGKYLLGSVSCQPAGRRLFGLLPAGW